MRRVAANELRGYVFDPADPERRFVVELLIDELPVAMARAELRDAEALDQKLGDGGYGFAFEIPTVRVDARKASVVLANSPVVIGEAALDSALSLPQATTAGGVWWSGGLRLQGFVDAASTASRVLAFVEGECVATCPADRWTPRREGHAIGVARRFDLFLPARFADGRLKRVRVADDEGRELSGSPCPLVAYEDGLAAFLKSRETVESETLRGELYDRLHPQALPFEQFQAWRARFPRPLPQQGPIVKVCVVLIGRDDVDASIESLEAQTGCDWIATSVVNAPDEAALQAEELRVF